MFTPLRPPEKGAARQSGMIQRVQVVAAVAKRLGVERRQNWSRSDGHGMAEGSWNWMDQALATGLQNKCAVRRGLDGGASLLGYDGSHDKKQKRSLCAILRRQAGMMMCTTSLDLPYLFNAENPMFCLTME